jgi:hypothetical protein
VGWAFLKEAGFFGTLPMDHEFHDLQSWKMGSRVLWSLVFKIQRNLLKVENMTTT